MKIAVAMPSHDSVPFYFAYDLASLASYTVAALPEDTQFGLTGVSGTYVHSARQELLESLLADGVDYVLWVDSDMRFPKDALVRLLMHREPIVGINYAKRTVPTSFVGIKRVGWGADEASERLVTDENSTGLEEVEALGFGLLLMRTDALRGLPQDGHPWFWFEWMPEKRQQVGEDVYFCRLLRESGQKILVDHDLSKECSHIGQFEYRCEHVGVGG